MNELDVIIEARRREQRRVDAVVDLSILVLVLVVWAVVALVRRGW